MVDRAEIDAFFKSPSIKPDWTGLFSVLYLLRRDISMCFGIHPDENRKVEAPAQWPGAMAILAGIDLLGKFYYGKDEVYGTQAGGPRFMGFIKDNFEGVTLDDEEVIYQLRNALLHSFGLYSKTPKGRIYKFALHTSGPFLVARHPPDLYQIDVNLLWRVFENSISAYYEKLIVSTDLNEKFGKMIGNYGWVEMSINESPDTRTSGFGGPNT